VETNIKNSDAEFKETVINIRRVAKVVKGGRRFGFSTLVVVGDGNGGVGLGLGKAKEVAISIRKAVQVAKKNMIRLQFDLSTIPYQIIGKFGAGKVLLKPASEGTGVIAGGSVRAVIEASGVKNILTKSLGSDNSVNAAKAAFDGLSKLMEPKKILELRKN
jgi:small subunit ribosomal protein S5